MIRALLLCVSLTLCIPSQAAEQLLERNLSDVIAHIEAMLTNESLQISEFAETNRFAIFYVLRPGKSTLTITAHQLPEQMLRTTLSVTSDSPRDEMLEKQFLDKLLAVEK